MFSILTHVKSPSWHDTRTEQLFCMQMCFNYAIWENTWAIYRQKCVLSDRCIIMLSTHFEQSFQSGHFHRSFLGVKTKRHCSRSTVESGTFQGTVLFSFEQVTLFWRIKLLSTPYWKWYNFPILMLNNFLSWNTNQNQVAPFHTMKANGDQEVSSSKPDKKYYKSSSFKGDISWKFSMFKFYNQVPSASTKPEN